LFTFSQICLSKDSSSSITPPISFLSFNYPERLKKLKLTTIAYRRIRGDMIETYKIINEKYDPEASSFLKLLSNSGNRFSRRNNSNKIV
jgi:hypothetical protein